MRKMANSMRNLGLRLSIHPGELKKKEHFGGTFLRRAGVDIIHDEITWKL